jgi:hypothetical protein
MVARQRRKAQLVREFRRWENEYSNYIGRLITSTHKMMLNGIHPLDLDLYAPLFHKLPIWEYHLEILASGDNQLKYQLYKEVQHE